MNGVAMPGWPFVFCTEPRKLIATNVACGILHAAAERVPTRSDIELFLAVAY
jgi:hypothetical protein